MIFRPFSFIPGPQSINYIEDSQNIKEIAEYPVFDVINYLLNVENIRTEQNGGHDPNKWQLKWEKDNKFMIISFTTFDGENFSWWGGSEIEACCAKQDIIELWLTLKKRFNAVWIHDENCNIYSIDAFLKEF